jgi:cell division protein ZapE
LPIDLDALGPVRRVYDEHVLSGSLQNDPAQIKLVKQLDQLITKLDTKRLSSKSSSLGWLFGKKSAENPGKDGLYIWGGVGRGKSFLMDMFFNAANISPKRRIHFNNFMQESHQLIHEQRKLFAAGKSKQEDPVIPVGKILAAKSKLLCFDEFSVSDIADALLLGRLFKVLFDEGTTIVATSNIPPQELYADGLNRQLFLPFIDLIFSRMNVHELVSINDYRLSKLPAGKFYSYPLNEHSNRTMDQVWSLLTDESQPKLDIINLKGRKIEVTRTACGVARFHFDQLCREPRGAADFLAIAKRYKSIMIDEIPILASTDRNEAKRLILLIDILYDNHCHLIASAEGPPESLYRAESGRESFEFARTASRLVEMQSKEYNSSHSLI